MKSLLDKFESLYLKWENLCGKSAHGKSRKHTFYEQSRITKTQGTLAKQIYSSHPHLFPGEVVETKAWEAIEELLSTPAVASEIINLAHSERSKRDHSQEEEKLKNKLYQLHGRGGGCQKIEKKGHNRQNNGPNINKLINS